MAKGDDIQERIVDFAVAVIRLTARLTRSPAEKHVGNQLLRSGTSPAPNYAEARSAESQKDFVHKLRIVLKELNEAHIWLAIIVRSSMLTVQQCSPLRKECDELCRIISVSIGTSIKRKTRKGAKN